MIWPWMFGGGLKQVLTLGRLRFVYNPASPRNTLTLWWRDTALYPGLK